MRKLFFLLMIGLITATTGAAQEASAPATDSKEMPTQPEKAVKPVTESEQPPADAFTPTETISEDLSVPFPVDI